MQKEMIKYYNENPNLLDNKLKCRGSRHAWIRRLREVNKVIKKQDKVLDLGCGAGHELIKMNSNSKIGLDISIENIKKAKGKGLVLAGDACSIPFKKELFNAVIMLELIEHVNDKEKLIRETRRALKKNGALIITTPNPKMDRVQRLMEKIGLIIKEPEHEYIENKELVSLLKKEGFKIIRNRYIFYPPTPRVTKLFESFLNKTPLRILGLSQLVICKKE